MYDLHSCVRLGEPISVSSDVSSDFFTKEIIELRLDGGKITPELKRELKQVEAAADLAADTHSDSFVRLCFTQISIVASLFRDVSSDVTIRLGIIGQYCRDPRVPIPIPKGFKQRNLYRFSWDRGGQDYTTAYMTLVGRNLIHVLDSARWSRIAYLDEALILGQGAGELGVGVEGALLLYANPDNISDIDSLGSSRNGFFPLDRSEFTRTDVGLQIHNAPKSD